MTPPTSTTKRGIAMMLGFGATGPVIDIFAKLATEQIPIVQISAARFLVQVLLLFPIAALLGRLALPGRAEIGLHFARGALVLAATTFFFAALRFMPVADAIAVFFVQPFVLILLSAMLLGEPVGWLRILACIAGFCGALLVIKPGMEAFQWATVLPVGTAFCFAGYAILTRHMSAGRDPIALQAYTALAAFILVAPVLWLGSGSGSELTDPVWPDLRFTLYLLSTGIAATVAHMFISYAFAWAPAATLAPLGYLEIVSATLLGWLVFRQIPDSLTFLGIAVVVSSGLFVLWRESVSASRPQPLPPGGPGAM